MNEKPSLLNRVFTIISEKDFENKFAPVYRKLVRLREKIGQKRKKFGIFDVHKFETEHLLQDFTQIQSFTEKIGDDVNNWEEQQQLTYPEKQLYTSHRKKVQLELDEIVEMIENRDPTFWEDVENLIFNLTRKVTEIMSFLPDLMPEPLYKFLFGKSVKSVRHLLPKSR